MRSGWMSWVRATAAGLALVAGLWAQVAGAAEVKNVTAKYAWPWGAYINYEVVGTIPANDPLIVTATDRTKNVTYTSVASALSGDTGTQAGTHCVKWDLDKQGVKIQSTNVVFTVEYRGAYCVVDLSAGANATSYPVTYLNEPPSGGFNTDVFKTTKLVLRRIEPGTFKMEGSYQTTLTKPYYIGVFEVTQKQCELVTGIKKAEGYYFTGDKRPTDTRNWDEIRGNTNWPASSEVSADSFMGRLRARTGLMFDLPTEAQWEYACRAGTTSAFNNGGNSTNDLNRVGWWYHNAWENGVCVHHAVGLRQPNAWGLYDMHGNVFELCLDWYGSLKDGVTDPVGASSGTKRVMRGGEYGSQKADTCTSSYRGGCSPASPCGFRIVRLSRQEEER